MLRDRSLPGNEQGYVSLARIRMDADLRHQTIATEFSYAAAALRRARDIAEALGNDSQEIEKLQTACIRLREKFSELNG